MAFKSGLNRDQSFIVSLDSLVSSDSDARVIDAFVNSLDLPSLGFKFYSSSKGNRSYSPYDLLKLYLLGYRRHVRSSRNLMYQAKNNIEFIWLLNGLSPDFRTISDFRKDNIDSLKSVMIQFNLDCMLLDSNLLSNISSQDGTKVKAVNSKENNLTLSKIDDRKKSITEHINEYLQLIDSSDKHDEKLLLQEKVETWKNKLASLEKMEHHIYKNNASQISLTDPDSKLMKDNGKFSVSYNNQVMVDTKSHMVQNFELYDSPADLGSMHSISKDTKDIYGFDTFTNITDKGYIDREDMMNCLLDGIIPEVTPKEGDSFLLETSYVENVITEDMKNSTDPKDIKTCLQAGVIPSVYNDSISSIEVKDSFYFDTDEDTLDSSSSSDEELRDFAIANHCFTRNRKNNKVFCPMGEILRKKSKNANILRFCNKLACKNCKNPCCSSEFKEVSFGEKQTISYPKNSTSSQKKTRSKRKKKVQVTKVFITLKVHRDLLSIRMQTSEHPHASMKFWDNARYMLLKGKRKVTGELALYYCAYNIRCASNLKGNDTLIEYFKQKKQNMTSIFDNLLLFFIIFNFCLLFVYFEEK